jgi:ribonuclease P protein component
MIKKRIREIIKTGKRFETENFILYFKKREDLKIGFITHSKIGKPVMRNKVKRIIREVIRGNFEKGDFLFILKKGIIEKSKDEIKNEIGKIKNEIGYSAY